MITTILFDLDGTLLPLDEKVFLKSYFGRMAKRFAFHGLDPNALIGGLLAGTEKMRKNLGPHTNETVFWDEFQQFVPQAVALTDEFERFYLEEFDLVQESARIEPLARQVIDCLHQKGYELVLATNPLFPRIATEKRIRWAGLVPADFSYISTYENSQATKPSSAYYGEILEKIHKIPSECLMIGNDASEDMAAGELGVDTFLVTDGLINVKNLDLNAFHHGDFRELADWIRSFPSLKQAD